MELLWDTSEESSSPVYGNGWQAVLPFMELVIINNILDNY
jgi:hypothetical protein